MVPNGVLVVALAAELEVPVVPPVVGVTVPVVPVVVPVTVAVVPNEPPVPNDVPDVAAIFAAPAFDIRPSIPVYADRLIE